MTHASEISIFCLLVGICGFLCLCQVAMASETVSLNLRSRDRASGAASVQPTQLDPRKIGIVVIDMWNYHWSATAAQRVTAMVPRMDRALRDSRRLGMQVFYCPTSSVTAYIGTPQREAVFAFPEVPLPEIRELEIPQPPQGDGCVRQDYKTPSNSGWDAMDPGLSIHEDDLFPNSKESLYSICRAKGITHLIYMGVHTQICVLSKDVGLRNMTALGMKCVLARDLTDAHPEYVPNTGLTPDKLTEQVVAHFERYLCPSVNLKDELDRWGAWSVPEPVDPVRLCPWGVPDRPHIFDEPMVITISAPWQPEAEIRYTLDGSEPTSKSKLYETPITIDSTTRLKAQAFLSGRPVCTETLGHYDRLIPMPPEPDVHLADIEPHFVSGPGDSPVDSRQRYTHGMNPPQKDRTNRGEPLRILGREYERGMGVHAPNHMIYRARPEWDRFVALAGVDDHTLDHGNGSTLARFPSTVFHVFIDGKEAAASPVMRLGEMPWRFNVKIPEGSKLVSLAVTDAGDGNREDLANWVEAGFVLKNR